MTPSKKPNLSTVRPLQIKESKDGYYVAAIKARFAKSLHDEEQVIAWTPQCPITDSLV